MKRIDRSLRFLALAPAALVVAGCSSLGDGVPGAAGFVGSGDGAQTRDTQFHGDTAGGDTLDHGALDGAPASGDGRTAAVPATAPSVAANGASDASSDAVRAVAVEASSPGVAARGTARRRSEADERILRLWRDEEFQRRLQMSYIPLTEIEPTATSLEQEELAEVVALLTEGDEGLQEARLLIERMRTDASSAVVHFWFGTIALQQSDLEGAEEGFLAAVERFPRFLRAWNSLGLVQAQLSDFEGAVVSFAKVLELGPASADTYGFLGIALASTNDHVGAESAFRMASLLAPKKFEWKVGLAQSLGSQGRFVDAIAQFDALIRVDADNPDLWLGQAQAFVKAGQFSKAAENLEFADLLNGSTVETLRLLGDIYTQEKLYDMAADAYIRAIDLDPSQAVAIGLETAKGLTSRRASEAALAIVEHLEGLGADPLAGEEGIEVLRVRATIARDRQDAAAERAVLEQIETADPLDGWAIIQLGELYGREGEYEEARYRFELASEMEGFTARAQLSLGRMLVSQGLYTEALVALRRSFREEPRDDLAGFIEQVERAEKTAR